MDPSYPHVPGTVPTLKLWEACLADTPTVTRHGSDAGASTMVTYTQGCGGTVTELLLPPPSPPTCMGCMTGGFPVCMGCMTRGFPVVISSGLADTPTSAAPTGLLSVLLQTTRLLMSYPCHRRAVGLMH